MKIQLDTDNKTIRLESNVILSKLIDTLNSLLPNKEWKKYTLETNTVINNWNMPYVIKERYIPSSPWYESPRPWITYCSTTGSNTKADYKVESGLYNLEIKA